MKKSAVIFLTMILSYSCSKNPKPEGLLPEDKMVEILVDIHMAEGMVSSLPIPYDSSKKLYPIFEKEVFAKHEISDSLYMESFEYYLRDLKTMERIYERTIDSLLLKEKTGDL